MERALSAAYCLPSAGGITHCRLDWSQEGVLGDKRGWWNRHLVPLGQMCSILEMPKPLLHAESDLRQLSKWLECHFSFLRSLPQTDRLLYYSYEALWTVSSLKLWKSKTKLRHTVQPGRQTIIPANVTEIQDMYGMGWQSWQWGSGSESAFRRLPLAVHLPGGLSAGLTGCCIWGS